VLQDVLAEGAREAGAVSHGLWEADAQTRTADRSTEVFEDRSGVGQVLQKGS
jgi:hypothetical protein